MTSSRRVPRSADDDCHRVLAILRAAWFPEAEGGCADHVDRHQLVQLDTGDSRQPAALASGVVPCRPKAPSRLQDPKTWK